MRDSGELYEPSVHSPGGSEPRTDQRAFDEAAAIFRLLGEPARLRLLVRLWRSGEMCVGELAEALDDNLSSVSQRLKLLRLQRIVRSRRQGKHVYYALADQHVAHLIGAGLEHAQEGLDDAEAQL